MGRARCFPGRCDSSDLCRQNRYGRQGSRETMLIMQKGARWIVGEEERRSRMDIDAETDKVSEADTESQSRTQSRAPVRRVSQCCGGKSSKGVQALSFHLSKRKCEAAQQANNSNPKIKVAIGQRHWSAPRVGLGVARCPAAQEVSHT